MSSIKICVVGAGKWGRNHVRTAASLEGARLAAVCDTDAAVLRKIAPSYPGALVTDSFDAALAAADAVVVAAPAAAHADLALRSIEAGKPVLVEKPFALTLADATRIHAAGRAAGVPVLVGHLLVFHPAVVRLKEMMAARELGSVYYIYSQRVNLGLVRPDENSLWSFGPHDVSVALELLGDAPLRVAATGKSYLQPGIEDVVFLTMEFATGVLVHVQLSWLDPHKERRMTVVGSEKMVVFDDMQAREKLKVYDKGVGQAPEYRSYGESLTIREGDIFIPKIPNVEPLAAELKHFVAVANGAANDRVDSENGVEVIRILEAASLSLKEGGRSVDLGERK